MRERKEKKQTEKGAATKKEKKRSSYDYSALASALSGSPHLKKVKSSNTFISINLLNIVHLLFKYTKNTKIYEGLCRARAPYSDCTLHQGNTFIDLKIYKQHKRTNKDHTLIAG